MITIYYTYIIYLYYTYTYIIEFDWIVPQIGFLHFVLNGAKVGVTFWYEYFRFSYHEKFFLTPNLELDGYTVFGSLNYFN